MEDVMKNSAPDKKENDIIFSKALKAGKRIYYLDVKKNRKDELFLAITESKKIVTGSTETPSVQFEKHKIFLYKEDFEKFVTGLTEAIQFIKENSSVTTNETEENTISNEGYEIEI
ncbi:MULTISPECIES: DUF3276 family protein [Bacteroidales]|jgi:hypothetical protein|uniref:DNA-binding protein n=1 Tax=Coprobacter secundus subsp. similis TaxID=2751153 RepID=A0A7G1HRV8_9BACT|nr:MULTISPECIES: DUF3276 family protein [Bacteroidales]KHM45792.1 hypothetical protein PU94_10670 [Coprobacter secundus]BCI62455.1 hypothetical protein Cop2CBH44_08080 [Coprobacter secundus subsp. similis]CCY36124.1 putative uncharacterized protein [Tannerella sp. CAG:118]